MLARVCGEMGLRTWEIAENRQADRGDALCGDLSPRAQFWHQRITSSASFGKITKNHIDKNY